MPDMSHRRQFIINALYFAIIVALVFLSFRYLLNLIWPFFVAFLFAWLLMPVIRWLTAKCHVKYNLSVALCLLVFFALLAGLTVFIAARLAMGIGDIIVWIPTLYTDTIQPALENLTGGLEELANNVSPQVYALVSDAAPNVTASIGSAVTDISVKAVSLLSGWATKLPSRLLSAVICVIATVFMTADFSRITAFLLRQVPERPRHVIRQAKLSFVAVLKKYVKSYGIIMGITFLEILVGLLILRQENALVIAALIAVFDIFPIVGAGMILVPWGIVTMLNGDLAKGIGLLALWVIVIVVRQIMEPRVVGHQVGLHPLVTLAAMFIGSKLFGGVGLLGLPITCAIVLSLDEAGVIHFIRREEENVPAEPSPEAAPDREKGKKE
jgi:sporulation integral membrane protein YtvI